MSQRIVKLEADNQKQAESAKMLWKYSAFSHDQINRLRHHAGLEPVDAPDFR